MRSSLCSAEAYTSRNQTIVQRRIDNAPKDTDAQPSAASPRRHVFTNCSGARSALRGAPERRRTADPARSHASRLGLHAFGPDQQEERKGQSPHDIRDIADAEHVEHEDADGRCGEKSAVEGAAPAPERTAPEGEVSDLRVMRGDSLPVGCPPGRVALTGRSADHTPVAHFFQNLFLTRPDTRRGYPRASVSAPTIRPWSASGST